MESFAFYYKRLDVKWFTQIIAYFYSYSFVQKDVVMPVVAVISTLLTVCLKYFLKNI